MKPIKSTKPLKKQDLPLNTEVARKLAVIEPVSALLARRAGAMARKLQDSVQDIRQKSEGDFVTAADAQIQDYIKKEIHARFPDHGFIGEESSEKSEEDRKSFTWVIDPIDGTSNYMHNSPLFAVSLGLLYQDKPVLGAVCLPYFDELYVGMKGKVSTLNTVPIHVSSVPTLGRALVNVVVTTRSNNLAPTLALFEKVTQHAQKTRYLGSCVLEMCFLASGRLDGFVFNAIHLWDFAAAQVIVEQAGGRVTDFTGQPNNMHTTDTQPIVASNGKIHDELLKVIAR
ncbi:inositol monophosphatase [Candidatus Woesearchaeota archaeon CG_4_10_14_0_8_um_filter_47_5]|nr:MAG: inositol monophosphatase [Candidatus Woesearchaeota archaeon CG_4_10_14_0_8_um_filter_47_5]